MRKSYFLSLGLSCWCKVQKEAVPVGRGGMRPAVLLQLHWLMPAAMFSAAIDRVFVAPPSVPVGGPVVPCFGMSRSCSVSCRLLSASGFGLASSEDEDVFVQEMHFLFKAGRL